MLENLFRKIKLITMLTLKKLQDMESHAIIDKGEAVNSPEGIFMTDSDIGRAMRWVAKRGNIDDWAIYIHWAQHDYDYIKNHGIKVTGAKDIKKLVPCDDEAFKRYRY